MWQRLRQARLAWPSALTAGALLLLIGLGIWQLERLQWKEALLAQIAARVTAAPVPLAAVERRGQAGAFSTTRNAIFTRRAPRAWAGTSIRRSKSRRVASCG